MYIQKMTQRSDYDIQSNQTVIHAVTGPHIGRRFCTANLQGLQGCQDQFCYQVYAKMNIL